MRRGVVIFVLVFVVGMLNIPVLDGQVVQDEQATRGVGERGIGLTVIAKGAVQPIIDHMPPGQSTRNAPLAFAVELDLLYRLPIDALRIDLGIGGRYLIERAIDGGANGYSLLPLYAMAQLPFAIPSLEAFWEIYLDGKIGYVFFLPTDRYRAAYLADTTVVGGLFLSFGLGTAYSITDWLQIRLLASYNIHYIDAMSRGTVEDNVFEVSVGVGFAL